MIFNKLLSFVFVIISAVLLISCDANYSQYKVGEVPVTDEGFYQNYLENINQAIEKSPSDAELYYIKAAKLLQSNKNNSALRTIEKALGLVEKDKAAKYHLLAAKIYSENEIYEKALQHVKKLHDYKAASAQTDALMADIFLNKGDLRKADSVSRLAIEKDPYNSVYYFTRGNILWSMNDTLPAKENLLKSIELNPATETYEKIFEVYLAEQNFEQAFQILNHLISLHPENLSYQYKKAEIYNAIKEEDKAKTTYRTIIAENPTSEDAYYNLSDMYLQKLRYDSAIYFQNQLIKQDSSNAEPYLNLARIYDRRFWYSSATDYYQRYLSLNPDNLIAQNELEEVQNKISYINRLRREKERLSNASRLKTIEREQPNKLE